jgi:hypothetical protein
MHNLSDEALCERWVENPYFQYFCGEVVFRHELPFDRPVPQNFLHGWLIKMVTETVIAVFAVFGARDLPRLRFHP